MDLQIKLLELNGRGNYLIVLTRGSLGIEGFEEVFRLVKDTTQPLVSCKILIDLADATCRLESPEMDQFIDEFSADFGLPDHRVAMISPADIGQYYQLSKLKAGLTNRGFKFAIFTEPKAAADWLADSR